MANHNPIKQPGPLSADEYDRLLTVARQVLHVCDIAPAVSGLADLKTLARLTIKLVDWHFDGYEYAMQQDAEKHPDFATFTPIGGSIRKSRH